MLLLVFIVIFVTDTYGQSADKFFRNDYKYMEAYQSFYKIHTIRDRWPEAKRMCALESATLWHPDYENEAKEVVTFWKRFMPHITWIFVGMSDQSTNVEGLFETVDGKSISDVYYNWQPGQPDNYRGTQNCVRMDNLAAMDDIECNSKYRYICKKTLSTLEWNNECNIPDLDYIYNNVTGNCYKLHATPMSWAEAYFVCQAEQSTLAVVRSRSEADFLAKLSESTPKPRFKGKYQRGIYHLGFHNRLNEGWQTVTGTSLNLKDDVWFDRQKPERNAPEECGSMLYTGLLINIDCETKSFFICEHAGVNLIEPINIKISDSKPYFSGGIK